MGKKHFSEEQIAVARKQAESGTVVAAIVRKRVALPHLLRGLRVTRWCQF